jgi:hypothetical protein
MMNTVYVLKSSQELWYGVPESQLESIKKDLSPGDLVIYPSKVCVAKGNIVLEESDE